MDTDKAKRSEVFASQWMLKWFISGNILLWPHFFSLEEEDTLANLQKLLVNTVEIGLVCPLMSSSSHIQSVLIGVKYRNCRLDVYLLFAILLGQIKSKENYRLAT